jgi:hypothetical protein
MTMLLVLSSITSCAKTGGGDINERQPQPELRMAALPELPQVALRHRVQGFTEIAHNSAALVGVLRPSAAPLAGMLPDASGAPRINGSVHFRPTGYPDIVVSYREDSDDLSVEDETVRHDHSTTADIGGLAALRAFGSGLDSVVAAGLVKDGELDRAQLIKSTILEAEAAQGMPVTVRIKEYEFTAPRVRAGVPVHGSGVTISVHRSGALARIKVFGPSFAPGAQDQQKAALVDQKGADARIAAAYPSARVEPLGLTYWLPPGQAKNQPLAVAPQYLYVVYQWLPAVQDGKNLVSMGIIVSVSSIDQNAKATVWTEPAPSVVQFAQKP